MKKQKNSRVFVISAFVILFSFSVFMSFSETSKNNFFFPGTGNVALSGEKLYATIEFEPHLEKEFEYRIIASANKDMNYQINIRGELATYFESSINEIFLEAGTTKNFDVKLSLPEKISPGLYKNYICIQETESIRQENNITIKTEVCSVINILSLDENEYLVIDSFNIKINKNRIVEFYLEVINYGKKEAGLVKAEINIFKQDNLENPVKSIITNEKTIKSNEEQALQAEILIGEGEYIARINIIHNEENKNLSEEQEFYVEDKLKIIDYTKIFYIGRDNPFKITLENNYDHDVEARAEIKISQFGEEKQSITINKTKLSAGEISVLEGNFYGCSLGEYDMEIKIFFENKIIIKRDTINVWAKEERPASESLSWIAIMIAIIAAILFILFFIKEMRKKQKR